MIRHGEIQLPGELTIRYKNSFSALPVGICSVLREDGWDNSALEGSSMNVSELPIEEEHAEETAAASPRESITDYNGGRGDNRVDGAPLQTDRLQAVEQAGGDYVTPQTGAASNSVPSTELTSFVHIFTSHCVLESTVASEPPTFQSAGGGDMEFK